jgi:hypothetical protein
MMKNNGCLFFITPNNWMTLPTNSDLRLFLLNETKNLWIVLNYDVFENASVDTSILGFSQQGTRLLRIYGWNNKIPILLSENCFEVYLKSKGYIFSLKNAKNDITLIERINNGSVVLSEIADVKNGVQAYTVGEGSPPCSESMRKNRVYHSTQKNGDHWIKYLDGVDVCRYYTGWEGQYIKYGRNLSRPRTPDLFKGQRILVRQIPGQLPYCIYATYTDEHTINDNNSMIVRVKNNDYKIQYILGILNSRLISFWFSETFGKLQRKVFPQFKVKELRIFPFRYSDNEVQLNITKLVDKVISDKKNNSSANTVKYERQIDTMVYHLYDLTIEEARIIDPTVTEEEWEKYKL